eukprot:s3247_g1.t1
MSLSRGLKSFYDWWFDVVAVALRLDQSLSACRPVAQACDNRTVNRLQQGQWNGLDVWLEELFCLVAVAESTESLAFISHLAWLVEIMAYSPFPEGHVNFEGHFRVILFKQGQHVQPEKWQARSKFSLESFRAQYEMKTLVEKKVRIDSQKASEPEMEMKPMKPKAFSSGGPLPPDPTAPATLTAALERTASDRGQRGLTLYGDGAVQRLTYAELLQIGAAADSIASFAVLQVPVLAQHFPCFWGCLLSGTKPVTVAIPPDTRSKWKELDVFGVVW